MDHTLPAKRGLWGPAPALYFPGLAQQVCCQPVPGTGGGHWGHSDVQKVHLEVGRNEVFKLCSGISGMMQAT